MERSTSMLARLVVGDRLPWRLNGDGKPLWLTVTEVLGRASYLVRYPDGHTEMLIDSE
jgi:hypothetical protein